MTRILLVGYDPEAVVFSDPALPPGMTAEKIYAGTVRAWVTSRGEIPKSVQDNGTPTNSVHVLDMAWVLPAFVITSLSLCRKRALGYTLAGVLLSYCMLLTLAILSMAVFMIRGGHPVVAPQVGIFGALLALSLGMLIWYVKGLKSPGTLNR